jgi:hypothetical protein
MFALFNIYIPIASHAIFTNLIISLDLRVIVYGNITKSQLPTRFIPLYN